MTTKKTIKKPPARKTPVTKVTKPTKQTLRPAIPIAIAVATLLIVLIAPLVPKALRYAGITRPSPTQAVTQKILNKAATFARSVKHLEPGATPDATRQKLLGQYPAQIYDSRVTASDAIEWDTSFTGSQIEGSGMSYREYIAKACVRFTLKGSEVTAAPLACNNQAGSRTDVIMLDKKRLQDELQKERPEDSLSKCSVDPSGCGG